MFRIGQKIVCVDAANRKFGGIPLVEGKIYTIRGFCENIHGEIGLLLEEVKASYPPLENGQERGFYQNRFRPVVERKTDISVSTKMLKTERTSASQDL